MKKIIEYFETRWLAILIVIGIIGLVTAIVSTPILINIIGILVMLVIAFCVIELGVEVIYTELRKWKKYR